MEVALDPAQPIQLKDCIPLAINSFVSNQVVRALIIMPMASDYLYFFREKSLKLEGIQSLQGKSKLSLLHLVTSLTNATPLRTAFHESFLLICTDKDRIQGKVIELQGASAASWLEQRPCRNLLWLDRSWDFLAPLLEQVLECKITPQVDSEPSWHFYRANMAGYGLSGRELLTALCMTSKTQVKVARGRLEFKLDR